jgi:uncharacterized membrane protein
MSELFAIALAALGAGLGLCGLLAAGAVAAVALDRLGALAMQVRVLEGRLRALEDAPRAPAVPAPLPVSEPLAPAEPAGLLTVDPEPTVAPPELPAPEVPAPPPIAPVPPRPAPRPAWTPPALSPERIAVWLGASIGAFALLIGGLLGLVAVAEAGWLGPAARVCFAMVAGTGLWVVGAALQGRVKVLPGALSGAGMGTLFGALFAAHGYYGLIGPLPTFGLLVAVAGLAGVRAVVHDARFMAWLGLIGAILAPVLVSTGNNGAVGLFAYLTLVLTGWTAAASIRRWPDIVLGAALGSGALYAGWTVSWYEPGSAWIAWIGAFVMAVPFAALAARSPEPGPHAVHALALRLVGALGASMWLVLALPWVLPIDALFIDPRSGLEVVRPQGLLREFGLLAVCALPVPLWLAGRWRAEPVTSGASSVFGSLLALAWGLGWARADHLDAWLSVGVVAPLFVGLLVHAGNRWAGLVLPVLLLPVVAVAVRVQVELPDGPAVAALALVLVLAGVLGSRTSTSGALLPAVAAAVGVLLAAYEARTEPDGTLWGVGPALAAIGAISAAALASRWRDDRLPELAWFGGVLVGPALFPALYVAWRDTLGLDAIGGLPLVLGLHGLLVAAVLVRLHRQGPNSPVLALAVAVALAGVTFALPVQIQERWLTVGWALECAALAWLATRLRHPLLPAGAVALAGVVGVRLLLNPWSLAWGDTGGWPVLNWTLYSWGVPTLALVAAAHWLQRAGTPVAPVMLRVLAMLTGFALVNVQVSDAFQDAGPVELGGSTMLQGMVRSLAWGGWGMLLLVIGLVADSRLTRFVGFSFILLAAFKVFVYDLWSLPGFVRVGSLLGLGFTLLVAAFLFERLVLRRTDAPRET